MRKGLWLVTLLLGLVIDSVAAIPFKPGDILLPYGEKVIGVFSPSGGPPRTTLSTDPSVFDSSTTSLKGGGIAFDENFEYLYVTVKDANINGNTNAAIVKFNAAGQKVATFIDNSVGDDFRDLAVRSGYIYVATPSGVRVYKADNGDYITTLGNINARSVAFDSQGTLYALTYNQVYKWDGSKFNSLDLTGLDDAHDLAFDSAGNLYVTDGTQHHINKFGKTDGGFDKKPVTITIPNFTTGAVFGIAYDRFINTFYASISTSQKINQIVTFNPNSSSTVDVPNTSDYSGVRWLEVYPTPEPASFMLFGSGLVVVLWFWRRRSEGQCR
ncbi:MAG: PEP-CTERM sorting domain-containing protein [Candidatus Bathyarchaeia archaeon]